MPHLRISDYRHPLPVHPLGASAAHAGQQRQESKFVNRKSCKGGGSVLSCRVLKRVAGIIMVALVMCACSLSKHIGKVSTRIDEMYSETKVWDDLPVRVITWQQAVSMIRDNNLDIKDMNDQLANAERQELSIYTNLIPGLSYYGYMTRSVAELSRPMSGKELSSRINMTFSVPALTRIPYDVYSSQVRTFSIVKAKEGTMRELTSRLYRQVRLREIGEAKKALGAGVQDAELDSEKERLMQKQSDERYWQDVAQILGDYSARWHILPSSMPHVRWEDYEPLLDQLGELVVCQYAMRLEQARLAQYGVALNYLPTINTGIYNPSLFSYSGGIYSGTFLNSRDTYINLSISYSLDTRLSDWNVYQQSKARYEREKEKVAAELMEHRNKVHTLRDSVKEYNNWRNYMHKRIAYLSLQEARTATEYMEREKTLYTMRMELLNQENNVVEHEAQAVLEYGMPDNREKRRSAPGSKG